MTITDHPLVDVSADGIRIKSACVGCGAEMFYVIDFAAEKFYAVDSAVLSAGAPEPEPEESGCAQYSHGHLCPPCSGAVADLLRRRREDRAKNHAAVARGHR
jgi:hypothetical protein